MVRYTVFKEPILFEAEWECDQDECKKKPDSNKETEKEKNENNRPC